MHEHEHDEAGRVVRTTVHTEAEFDERERGYMLALAVHETNACSGCGGQLTETTDPDSKWAVDPPTRCFKCTAIGVAKDQFEKDARGNPRQPQALYWVARSRHE